jgi:hypothetical protein
MRLDQLLKKEAAEEAREHAHRGRLASRVGWETPTADAFLAAANVATETVTQGSRHPRLQARRLAAPRRR